MNSKVSTPVFVAVIAVIAVIALVIGFTMINQEPKPLVGAGKTGTMAGSMVPGTGPQAQSGNVSDKPATGGGMAPANQ
jgi:hypothetical protein